MPQKYSETFIQQIRETYDYKTNLENPYLIEKSEELIGDDFMLTLKIIEKYEKKISLEIKNYSPKTHQKKNYRNQKHQNSNNKNKMNFQFMRVPKERPVTFLNEKKGEKEELQKEINGNLNKLTPVNEKKIFDKLIELFTNNLEIFDFHFFIDTLFDKAVMQPIYCPVYVRLFLTVRKKHLEINKIPDQGLNQVEDEENEEDDKILEDPLSDLIRGKCDLFMKMITDFQETQDDVLNVNDYDDFCQKNKQKVYKKGFSQFIGELYRNRFVDATYLSQYTSALSDNILHNLSQNDTNIENASVCLVQLMETTMKRRLFRNNDSWKKIKEIKDHPNLPKKLKFKFMDLLGI